jgi:hypothetical protein
MKSKKRKRDAARSRAGLRNILLRRSNLLERAVQRLIIGCAAGSSGLGQRGELLFFISLSLRVRLLSMPKVMCLYLDDSGTRNPDRKIPERFMFRDWFTLGGYTMNEEDEGDVETAHGVFCDKWGINYPLHSYEIRSETENFTWLSGLGQREYEVHA